MFGLWGNKAKRLKKQIRAKHDEAVRVQRDGYLRTYGKLMIEIEELEKELALVEGQAQ